MEEVLFFIFAFLSTIIGTIAGTCNPTSVKMGQATTCTATVAAGSSGDRFKDTITLAYTESSGISHQKTGSLATRYE